MKLRLGLGWTKAWRGAVWAALVAAPALFPEAPVCAEPAESLLGRPIAAVRFESAEPVDADALRELVPLREGTPATSSGIEEARRLLGLKDVWSEIAVELRPRGESVEVVFRLERRLTVGAVRIKGHRRLGTAELLRRARVEPGVPADEEILAGAADRLREMYARRGFDEVVVQVWTRPMAGREADITFVIEEGEPVTVAEIAIEGEPVFPADEVRGALSVRPGRRYERGLERQVLADIRRFYRRRAYYAVSARAAWERAPGTRAGVLRISVDPGVRFDVRFRGNRLKSRRDLLDLFDLYRRPVVTDGTWRELAKRIARAYREAGHSFVNVDLRVGAGDPKQIEFTIREGRRYTLRRIDFAGALRVPAERLLEEMATRPKSWVPFSRGGVLVDEVLDDDLRRLWFLYRRLGFHAAEIVDARPNFEEATGDINLTIEVDEGPRSVVTRVDFENFDERVALPALATRVGEVYDPEAVEADRAALAAAVAKLGYPEAAVTAAVGEVRAKDIMETEVRFLAAAGPERRIGPVIVQGNQLTRDRVVLRELPFAAGAPYDPRAIQRGQDDLYRLGLFRRVSVRPLEGASDAAPAIGVAVDERSPGSLQYGFGYNTSLGFRAFGEAAYDNLHGMARRVSARAEVNLDADTVEPDEYLGNLGYREPRFLDSRFVARANAIIQRSTRNVDRFALQRFSVITALERELRRGLTVGGEAEFEQADVFDVAPDLVNEGIGFLRTASFGPLLVLDRRDDAFAPRRGTFDSLRVRYAAPALASDLHFVRVVGQHTHYVPLVDDVGFVYAARAGWARTVAAADVVPLRQRFFLGGRTTVRGFDENGIGPRGSQGSPRGGDLTANLNAELRFPLWFGVGGAVFADAGGVYLQREAVSLHDFRRSVGGGLRYVTPIGPISLEYGVKLDRRACESVGALHFTIGNIF